MSLFSFREMQNGAPGGARGLRGPFGSALRSAKPRASGERPRRVRSISPEAREPNDAGPSASRRSAAVAHAANGPEQLHETIAADRWLREKATRSRQRLFGWIAATPCPARRATDSRARNLARRAIARNGMPTLDGTFAATGRPVRARWPSVYADFTLGQVDVRPRSWTNSIGHARQDRTVLLSSNTRNLRRPTGASMRYLTRALRHADRGRPMGRRGEGFSPDERGDMRDGSILLNSSVQPEAAPHSCPRTRVCCLTAWTTPVSRFSFPRKTKWTAEIRNKVDILHKALELFSLIGETSIAYDCILPRHCHCDVSSRPQSAAYPRHLHWLSGADCN